ncbi:MAG: hypothetical protein OXN89_06550 [Bryobacterales bacterium]|nr:hypothetical protein [Bryobacterales bacterium]
MTTPRREDGFDKLRREYEAMTIGPLIWTLTVELAGMVGRRYRPAAYNRGAAWDDASVEELAQETAVELLIGERQIDYIFTVADSTEDVRRLLVRNVKRALWRRHSETVVDRLMGRVRRTASQPPFRLQSEAGQRWITLVEEPGTPRALNDAELRAASAAAHRAPRLIEREDAERASMVYAPAALRELLHAVIGVTGGVFENDLARILRILLTAWLPASLVSVESDDLADTTAGVRPANDGIDRQDMETAMRDLVESMTVNDLTVLVCKTQGLSDQSVAERLGRSRPWVADRKEAVLSRTDATLARVPEPLHDEAAAHLLELASDRLGESLE